MTPKLQPHYNGNIRQQSNTVRRNAARAVSQLKPIHAVLDAVSPEEQIISSIAAASVVKIKFENRKDVADAIESLQKYCRGIEFNF